MDEYSQWPKQGIGADLAALTNNWPDFRSKIAQWNSGASDKKPTAESMAVFFGGTKDSEEELYNKLLAQFLAQSLRDRSNPDSLYDDPAIKGAVPEPGGYIKR